MNILVVKPSSLGDIVHTLPAVDLLHRARPEASITWVVSDAFAGLIDLFPAVDDVVLFRRKRLGQLRHCREIAGFLRDLRQRRYDVALDFQGLLRSGLMAFASGAPRRVGFRSAREGAPFFYSERVLLPANLKHAVEKNVFLVRSAFGISEDIPPPRLREHHDFTKCARRLFKETGIREGAPILAVAPGARWESKRWDSAFFARVLDEVCTAMPDCRVWLLGTLDEKDIAASVISACVTSKPVNLAGETNLGTLTEMIRRSGVLLTNDSGPMHLAAALGVPAVAFFGATDPDLTGPYGENHAVIRTKCELSPCMERRCRNRARDCWDGTRPEDVSAAVVERLRRRVPGSAPAESVCESVDAVP